MKPLVFDEYLGLMWLNLSYFFNPTILRDKKIAPSNFHHFGLNSSCFKRVLVIQTIGPLSYGTGMLRIF